MTDSIKINTKKASFILAATAVIYSAVGTYLFIIFRINLMEYTTPVILSAAELIVSCGVLQRLFNSYLAKSKFDFSFGRQRLSPEIEVIEPANEPKEEQTVAVHEIIKASPSDNYEARLIEIENEKIIRRAEIMRSIHEYTTYVLAKYFPRTTSSLYRKT